LKRLLPIAAVLVVAAIFLGFAGDGLFAYFTPDDMMNIYRASYQPQLTQLRPMGGLVNHALFLAAGLNPLPYRVVCFLLLAGNLVLLYAVAARLSGSRTVAAFACLLGAYHAHLADFYYSDDTIFDLLCFAFYWGAVLLWMRGRPWLATLLCAGALLSKEMAVSLPVILLGYELLERRKGMLLRLLPMVAVTAGFVGLALFRAREIGDFQPHYTWAAMSANWASLTSDLFYGAIRMTAGRVLLLWGVLAGLVLLVRTRDAVVSLAVIWIGLLPVAFIAPRGFYVIYLTLPGWYILAARLIERATRRVHPAVVFAVIAVLLVPLHAARKEKGRWWVADAHASVRAVLEPLRRETLPRGARVLIADDPYDRDDFILTFMFRLSFRDPDLRVDRGKVKPPATDQPYDRVYRIVGDKPANWRLQKGE